MLTHIIVPASSTIGEFFDGIFPDAGCLLNRLVECRTSNSESRDVLGWDVTWEELEPPRYVIFQPLDQMSAYFLERDGKEFFFPNTPASSDVPEGHLAVRVLVENDPCLLARVQMLEDRVLVLERAAARRLNPECHEGNDIGEERNEGRKQQRRFMGIFVTGPSAHKLLYLVDTPILGEFWEPGQFPVVQFYMTPIYQLWWSMSVRQTMVLDQSRTNMTALGKEMFHKSRVLLVGVFLTRCPYSPKGGKIKVKLHPF